MHGNGQKSLAASERSLADLGELAGPLTHEMNNLLNTLTLHVAIWQQSGPKELAPDLQLIRERIAGVAKIIRRFQRRRHTRHTEAEPLDVNNSVRQALEEMPASPDQATIVLELEPDLPLLRGNQADFRRLCRFLLSNAVRAVPPGGPAVTLRTSHTPDTVLLQVEDAGPSVPEELLPQVFETGGELREGMCCLELASCQSIVERMGGKIHAKSRPQGGLIVVATIPCNP